MAVDVRGPMFKVCLLGEVGVGKTSLFYRLKDGRFHEYVEPTKGIDSCSKVLTIDGRRVTLAVWDTAGVERFRTLTSNYYRNAHAAILVYSVDEPTTLHYLPKWLDDAVGYAPKGGLAATVYLTITGTERNAPGCFYFSYTLVGGLTRTSYPSRKGRYWFRALKVLVGNKSDLEAVVGKEAEGDFAEVYSCDLKYRISTKTGDGVEDAVKSICELLLKNMSAKDSVKADMDGFTEVDLNDEQAETRSKCKC